MNLISASKKFLYKLAKNFIESYNISYEETNYNSYHSDGEISRYFNKIIKFLNERGLLKDGEDEFFYVFIKKNRDYLFSSKPFSDNLPLEMPALRRFSFNWNTTQSMRISATYLHKLSTFLDEDEVEDRILYLRYNGEIYPADGDEIDYETLDSDLEEDDIDNIKEIIN